VSAPRKSRTRKPRTRTPEKPTVAATSAAPPDVAALIRAMDGLDTAEALHDKAIRPFVTALEDVCRARGYVLNVYGDGANLIVTGDAEASEAVYEMVDHYLDARGVGDDD
jgi:hypothetical protein